MLTLFFYLLHNTRRNNAKFNNKERSNDFSVLYGFCVCFLFCCCFAPSPFAEMVEQ